MGRGLPPPHYSRGFEDFALIEWVGLGELVVVERMEFAD